MPIFSGESISTSSAIPTVEEAEKFFDERRQTNGQGSSTLLARNDDYAAHWTPFLGRSASVQRRMSKGRGIVRRGNNRQWIFKSFKENKPYDFMVAELIDPTLPGYRKPKASRSRTANVWIAAYIPSETHEETIQSAAAVSQVFLGTGMKCASCHNHFLNKEWPQARFLSFAECSRTTILN